MSRDLGSLKMSQNAKGIPSATWSKMAKANWPPEAAENFRIFETVPTPHVQKKVLSYDCVFGKDGGRAG